MANCFFDVREEIEDMAVSIDFDRLGFLSFDTGWAALCLDGASWWRGLGIAPCWREDQGCGYVFQKLLSKSQASVLGLFQLGDKFVDRAVQFGKSFLLLEKGFAGENAGLTTL